MWLELLTSPTKGPISRPMYYNWGEDVDGDDAVTFLGPWRPLGTLYFVCKMGYSVPDKSFAGKTWHHPSIGSNRSQQSRLETGSACKETWTSEKIVGQTGNRRIGRTRKQVYSGIFAEEGVIGIGSTRRKEKAHLSWRRLLGIPAMSSGHCLMVPYDAPLLRGSSVSTKNWQFWQKVSLALAA